jgi:pyruvate/2-oxoglutarate dehydrogenase complex dihydrolipoamide acyltransferase (E2) component
MSDQHTTVLAPESTAPRAQKTGTVGLVLAIIAAVTSVIPVLNFFTWMIAVPALALGIIALVKKNSPRGKALATVITAGAAWLLSILMFVTVAAIGLAGSSSDVRGGLETASESAQESPEANPEATKVPKTDAEIAAEEAEAAAEEAEAAAEAEQEALDAAAAKAAEEAAAAAAEAARGTVSQQNAARSANSYLDLMGFSRTGLIGQLEYEGYSTADATWGVDKLGADWNAEAAESAASYLAMTSFSRSGLIDQLLYEGFTPAEAEYGVSTTGL